MRIAEVMTHGSSAQRSVVNDSSLPGKDPSNGNTLNAVQVQHACVQPRVHAAPAASPPSASPAGCSLSLQNKAAEKHKTMSDKRAFNATDPVLYESLS
jgi:hypothetical protein